MANARDELSLPKESLHKLCPIDQPSVQDLQRNLTLHFCVHREVHLTKTTPGERTLNPIGADVGSRFKLMCLPHGNDYCTSFDSRHLGASTQRDTFGGMSLATTAPSALREGAGQGAWRLLVVHVANPGALGSSLPLTEAVTLGREPTESGFRLDDDEVSRRHAQLEPLVESGSIASWRVRDLESRNGTFVDGARIDEAPLVHGSVIRIGTHLLLLQYLTAFDLELMLMPPKKFGALIGQSAGILRVQWGIGTYGKSALAVLVRGETGVGKERVAAGVHTASGRSGDFVPVNCAALPAHLVESELFGHAKGAFTGASNRSEGLFGRAAGGTLFLDELGEMPLELQAKLLRALATGEVRGVGETRERTIDVRVVAATNVDLELAIEEGTFRADLYSRLMAATIEVPPLRDRREDILVLAAHFLAQSNRHEGVSTDAAEALLTHDWPFNVREIEQCVGGAVLRSPNGELSLSQLPDSVGRRLTSRSTSSSPRIPSETPLALRINPSVAPSADDLRAVLAHFEGSVALVARFFGKDRRQIYRWAERLEVDLDAFR